MKWQARLEQQVVRIGRTLHTQQDFIRQLQWWMLGAYLFLLVVPVWIELPPEGASIFNHLGLFAQFVFWGLWWPFVMLSVMLFGRVWCGIFCPEGMLTELASKHGRAYPIPRWMRWGGWPTLAFFSTTIYGQLISVYEYPKAALLILGGSSVIAILVGVLYGKEKRVWCRYLCPASGIFSLLARLSPFAFTVDQHAWKHFSGVARKVNCAPLLDMRHMSASSQCHMCGRCDRHRNAISLRLRSSSLAETESTKTSTQELGSWDAYLLLYGVLGLAVGAFQWTVSPYFVLLKLRLADFLIEHEIELLFRDDMPWWVLTHYPQQADVFSLLDGLCLLLYMLIFSAGIGSLFLVATRLAAKILPSQNWRSLSMVYLPLGGISLFLGLSMMTLTQLRAEAYILPIVNEMRAILLLIAAIWTAMLIRRKCAQKLGLGALILYSPALILLLIWCVQFYSW